MRSDLVYVNVEINPLQVVQQAAVEERPDFEDPVRFVIRTWPWPDQPEGLPQVQELIRNPLLIYTAMMLSIEELLLFTKSTFTLALHWCNKLDPRLCTAQTHTHKHSPYTQTHTYTHHTKLTHTQHTTLRLCSK